MAKPTKTNTEPTAALGPKARAQAQRVLDRAARRIAAEQSGRKAL
jgi:hypothetical protein